MDTLFSLFYFFKKKTHTYEGLTSYVMNYFCLDLCSVTYELVQLKKRTKKYIGLKCTAHKEVLAYGLTTCKA